MKLLKLVVLISVAAIALLVSWGNSCLAAYKMEKQVEMQLMEEVVYFEGYVDTIYHLPFLYESAKYSNATFYFEAVIKTDNSRTTCYASLRVGGSTVGQVSTNSTSWTRLRSGAISLSNNGEYHVQLSPGDGASGDPVYIRNARIIVVQNSSTGITATETHALVSGYNRNLEVATNYSEPLENIPLRYYWDPTWFSGTVTVIFEAYLQVQEGYTGYVKLYDTLGNAVSGSELNCTYSSTPTRVRSGGLTLTSGRTYTVKVKSDDSYGVQVEVYGAKLIIQQSDASNVQVTESYYHLNITDNDAGKWYSNTNYANRGNYNQFNPDNWGPNTPAYYHEVVYRMLNSAYTGYLQLAYCNDASCSSATQIDVRSGTSSSVARLRSPAITMPASTQTLEMYGKVTASGYLYTSGTKVVVQSIQTATAVGLTAFTARSDGEHVALEWKTGYEVNNLGFHVYREENGQRTRLNKEMIAGSALMAGKGIPTAGYSYSWIDELGPLTLNERPSALRSGPASLKERHCNFGRVASSEALLESWQGPEAPQAKRSAVYWLEDIDLSGKRTWHGPVTPVVSGGPLPKRTQAVLLSHLNRESASPAPERYRAKARGAKDSVSASASASGSEGSKDNLKSAIRNPHSAFVGRSAIRNPHSAIPGPRGNISVRGLDDGAGTFQGPLPLGISDKARAPAADTQQAIADSPAVKIFIQEEGWYRITQPELVSAGMNPGVNPRFLQLFADGQEEPLLIGGRKDGEFGDEDFIEFYGRGADTPFTGTRVYWLVAGSRPGKRVHQRGGPSVTPPASTSYLFTVEKKDRVYYLSMIKNNGAEKYFGPIVSSEPADQALTLRNLDPSPPGEASLEIALQGLSTTSHQVQVLLNETSVGSVIFSGQLRQTLTFPISQAGLKEGENVVRLTAQGGEGDVTLVDYLRLTYWHTYTADEDFLRFPATGGQSYLLDGFGTSRIRVLDITNPQQVYQLRGVIQAKGSGYSVQVTAPGSGQRTLLAFTETQVKTPAALEANRASGWSEAGNGADLVIISPEIFMESLTALKVLRESQGLSVALVDIEDIYDEFSYGIKTPQAVKDFLYRAKSSWQRPPRFILLVGDASFDPRNYQGYGNFDFIPTKLVETSYLETACDDCLVDFNNDGLPDIAIGRLPVRTPEEAQIVVSKIVGYESQSILAEALLVADIDDQGFSFEEASNQVKALLPTDVTSREVFRGSFGDDDDAKGEILSGFGRGPLLANYVGHGSVGVWRGNIFDADDADGLSNGYHLPLAIAMTCLNGFFHDAAATESLAEALLKAPSGGAVAVWASSGLTTPDPQTAMNKALIGYLFNGESLTIGEAIQRAKASTDDQDVRRTWVLFGDPTTRLKY